MAKVMLLACSKPGLELAKFLSYSNDDDVVALYLSGNDNECDNQIIRHLGASKKIIHSPKDLQSTSHLKYLDSLDDLN